MSKIIFDNERCMLHSAVELFLKENKIIIHRTTAHNKTGNADIERLHGTLNEHLRIMEIDKINKTQSLDDKIHNVITIYNNTIHTTTKLRPSDFITKNYDRRDIETLFEKYKQDKINRINKINQSKDRNYELTNNIVRNREIAKIKPKYKKLNQFRVEDNYVIDTSNKRNTKYSRNQMKRKNAYQNN